MNLVLIILYSGLETQANVKENLSIDVTQSLVPERKEGVHNRESFSKDKGQHRSNRSFLNNNEINIKRNDIKVSDTDDADDDFITLTEISEQLQDVMYTTSESMTMTTVTADIVRSDVSDSGLRRMTTNTDTNDGAISSCGIEVMTEIRKGQTNQDSIQNAAVQQYNSDKKLKNFNNIQTIDDGDNGDDGDSMQLFHTDSESVNSSEFKADISRGLVMAGNRGEFSAEGTISDDLNRKSTDTLSVFFNNINAGK